MAIQYSSSLSPAQMHEENDRNPPSDDDLDRDIPDSYSDTSDDLVEVSAPDFPRYFQERGGRLFHSHGNAPYPLPVDAPEQQVRAPGVVFVFSGVAMLTARRQRVDTQHNLLRRLLGRHCRGPVARVLRERRRVLDLCTGTGRWQVAPSAYDR